MKILTAFYLITLLVLLFSCMPHDNKDGVVCTTEYRMLTVSVKDTTSQPVHLSSYYVKKTSTGEIMDFAKEDHYTDSINSIQGIYFLFTDGKMGMTSKNGTEFEFHGKLDTSEIVNEHFIIGNDECHVKIMSGNTAIIISK